MPSTINLPAAMPFPGIKSVCSIYRCACVMNAMMHVIWKKTATNRELIPFLGCRWRESGREGSSRLRRAQLSWPFSNLVSLLGCGTGGVSRKESVAREKHRGCVYIRVSSRNGVKTFPRCNAFAQAGQAHVPALRVFASRALQSRYVISK